MARRDEIGRGARPECRASLAVRPAFVAAPPADPAACTLSVPSVWKPSILCRRSVGRRCSADATQPRPRVRTRFFINAASGVDLEVAESERQSARGAGAGIQSSRLREMLERAAKNARKLAPESFLLRMAREDDLDEIAGVYVSALQCKPDGFWKWRNSIRQQLADQNTFLFVATKGERIVGAVTLARGSNFAPARPGIVYLSGLNVHNEFQRRGIGKMLMSQAESFALSHGMSTVFLHVRDDDRNAKKFYERLGYRPDWFWSYWILLLYLWCGPVEGRSKNLHHQKGRPDRSTSDSVF